MWQDWLPVLRHSELKGRLKLPQCQEKQAHFTALLSWAQVWGPLLYQGLRRSDIGADVRARAKMRKPWVGLTFSKLFACQAAIGPLHSTFDWLASYYLLVTMTEQVYLQSPEVCSIHSHERVKFGWNRRWWFSCSNIDHNLTEILLRAQMRDLQLALPQPAAESFSRKGIGRRL